MIHPSYSCYLCASWSDDELNRIVQLRKKYANMGCTDKECKRECKKMIKACTIVLDHFLGRSTLTNKNYPIELESYLNIALGVL